MKWRVGAAVVVVVVLGALLFSRSGPEPEIEPSREVLSTDRGASSPGRSVVATTNCAALEDALAEQEQTLPEFPRVELALWSGQLERVAGVPGPPPTAAELERLATMIDRLGVDAVVGTPCSESPCLLRVLGSEHDGGIPHVEQTVRERVESLGGHILRSLLYEGRIGAWVSTAEGEPVRVGHRTETMAGVRPEPAPFEDVEAFDVGGCRHLEARADALTEALRERAEAEHRIARAKAVVEAVEGPRGEAPPAEGPDSPDAVEAIADLFREERGWECLVECEEAPCVLSVKLKPDDGPAYAMAAVERALESVSTVEPMFIPDCHTAPEMCIVTVFFSTEGFELGDQRTRSVTRHKALTQMWSQ